MKAAGYYNATGKKDMGMLAAGLVGTTKYSAPTYGEDLYSARWIARGIQANPNEVRLRCSECQNILNQSSAINDYDKNLILQQYFKR